MLDLAVIGAGPCGLAVGVAALAALAMHGALWITLKTDEGVFAQWVQGYEIDAPTRHDGPQILLCTEGATVVLLLRAGLWAPAPCRVVYAVKEPRRRGFADP